MRLRFVHGLSVEQWLAFLAVTYLRMIVIKRRNLIKMKTLKSRLLIGLSFSFYYYFLWIIN